MLDRDLVRTVAEEANLGEEKTAQVVSSLFNAIVDKVNEKERVVIRGFGSFSVRECAYIHPKTSPLKGQKVTVNCMRFKAAKSLKSKVNPPM